MGPELSAGGDAARSDGNSAIRAAAGHLAGAQTAMGPHVELDFFGQAEVVVSNVRKPVTSPGPGLDFEEQRTVVAAGMELDLPGLQMPAKGGQT